MNRLKSIKMKAGQKSLDSRLPKPPKPPEKPLMPYMRYSRKVWESVKNANPLLKLWEVGKIIGQMWRELPENEKSHFIEEYENDKIQYNDALRMYHNSPAYKTWLLHKEKAEKSLDDSDSMDSISQSQFFKQKERMAKDAHNVENRESYILEDNDEDPDEIFTVKHVATQRFQRNHKFMLDLFSDSKIPELGSLVTESRLNSLKQQVNGLLTHKRKLDEEIDEWNTKHESKKLKIKCESERFWLEYNKELEARPIITETMFSDMVKRARDDIIREEKERDEFVKTRLNSTERKSSLSDHSNESSSKSESSISGEQANIQSSLSEVTLKQNVSVPNPFTASVVNKPQMSEAQGMRSSTPGSFTESHQNMLGPSFMQMSQRNINNPYDNRPQVNYGYGQQQLSMQSSLQPPMLQPQSLQPPSLQPPSLQSPPLQPPLLQPPSLQPPSLQPPSLQPPSLQPPSLQPPSLQPPSLQPPSLQPPSLQPSSLQPPSLQPQSLQPPSLQPPSQPPQLQHTSLQSSSLQSLSLQTAMQHSQNPNTNYPPVRYPGLGPPNLSQQAYPQMCSSQTQNQYSGNHSSKSSMLSLNDNLQGELDLKPPKLTKTRETHSPNIEKEMLFDSKNMTLKDKIDSPFVTPKVSDTSSKAPILSPKIESDSKANYHEASDAPTPSIQSPPKKSSKKRKPPATKSKASSNAPALEMDVITPDNISGCSSIINQSHISPGLKVDSSYQGDPNFTQMPPQGVQQGLYPYHYYPPQFVQHGRNPTPQYGSPYQQGFNQPNYYNPITQPYRQIGAPPHQQMQGEMAINQYAAATMQHKPIPLPQQPNQQYPTNPYGGGTYSGYGPQYGPSGQSFSHSSNSQQDVPQSQPLSNKDLPISQSATMSHINVPEDAAKYQSEVAVSCAPNQGFNVSQVGSIPPTGYPAQYPGLPYTNPPTTGAPHYPGVQPHYFYYPPGVPQSHNNAPNQQNPSDHAYWGHQQTSSYPSLSTNNAVDNTADLQHPKVQD